EVVVEIERLADVGGIMVGELDAGLLAPEQVRHQADEAGLGELVSMVAHRIVDAPDLHDGDDGAGRGAIGQRQVGAHLTVAELHPDVSRLHWWLYPSAPLPKFVIHCGTLSHELRKQKGHWQAYDSSAAFRFEVPAMSLPRPVQELQIGGT